MHTADTHATAPVAATTPRTVKRRQNGRAALPKQTEARLVDGGKSVMVALHGTRGRGKCMTLDARDWHHIKTTIGDVWGINVSGTGLHFQVRCGAARVAALAKQPGERPTATLARILMNAKRGEVVKYRDGNPLNLRRENLEVVSRAEAAARRRAPSV
ncbi:HNH endonuclease [Roseomonas sp. HJA6]|uniref:HNH endonuclease n=1 Tax=Roseomonas alba TaxID=2846776 RepID=A0ABS7ABU9_9PROT|nr:HNH endonuclease [Neoroseomonas alba]MBW6398659.1 HNH endonuclease [Neoroseomonas alba]